MSDTNDTVARIADALILDEVTLKNECRSVAILACLRQTGRNDGLAGTAEGLPG